MNASATKVNTVRDDVVARRRVSGAPNADGLDGDCVNAIRFLSIDAVQKANSGHPGAPMGLAPLAYRLFTRYLKHDPTSPNWLDRDRFVLSNGHASMLLYASLHLSGYDLSIDDIKNFRQWDSRTPGHPELKRTPGVEITTGPLGQGFANAVGLAMAERMLAARFNEPGATIVDHRTWCVCSDGDMMEGITSEAASLVGRLHHGLGKLTVFFDSNQITLEGKADVEFSEDVVERFDAIGWHVHVVENVNDLDEIDRAIATAEAAIDRPSLIICRSHIGFGSPQQDTAAAHGAALGKESVAKTRERLGWKHPPFVVPDEVYRHWRGQVGERALVHAAWQNDFAAYRANRPDQAAAFERTMAGRLPEDWRDVMPEFVPGKSVATRIAGSEALNAFATVLPELVGGSADVSPSTHTVIADSGEINSGDWGGSNIHFGIREHAMGAICNGMAAHGGLRPFCSTFLSFKDYMAEPVRLAAMMRLPVVFVFTHDSIGLGEDGPTHQPVEHLAGLRAIPDLRVFRPADSNESAQAWGEALAYAGPSAIILSRQGLPTLDPAVLNVRAGASVVAPGDHAAILATGSEVALGLSARRILKAQNISVRVVSMPCVEIFRSRPAAERAEILPPAMPTLAVEAAAPLGWHEFADDVVGLTRFGASAPGPIVFEKLGFTAEAVAGRVLKLLERV